MDVPVVADLVPETPPSVVPGTRLIALNEGGPLLLTIFAYLVGSILLAPIVPSLLILLVYLVVIEAITYATYQFLGWTWSPLIRGLLFVAAVVGYVIGLVFYYASTYVLENN